MSVQGYGVITLPDGRTRRNVKYESHHHDYVEMSTIRDILLAMDYRVVTGQGEYLDGYGPIVYANETNLGFIEEVDYPICKYALDNLPFDVGFVATTFDGYDA